jgi:hypothetical protein
VERAERRKKEILEGSGGRVQGSGTAQEYSHPRASGFVARTAVAEGQRWWVVVILCAENQVPGTTATTSATGLSITKR